MPSPQSPGLSSEACSAVVLRHADRELVLLPGTYLIGRSRSCHLVINDEVVSRRHAELEVSPEGHVILRDLSSHNGVIVNNRLVDEAAIPLFGGDSFVIGADSFQIFILDDAIESATMKVVEVVTDRASTVVKRAPKAVTDDIRATHDLDLVAAVADCAFVAGQYDQAERILAGHLRAVLADIRGLRQTDQPVRDKAYLYALRLAAALHKPEWFDLAVDLLFVQAIVCTEQQAEELLRVWKLLPNLDTHRVVQYAQIVRHRNEGIRSQRIGALLDAIVGTRKNS